MIVYYENMNGEKLNLLKAPFRTTKTDWFNADWSESSEGYEKTVTVDVFGKREEFRQNMEQLYRILAVDAENNSYGKLYVNGAYLRCRVLKSVKEGKDMYIPKWSSHSKLQSLCGLQKQQCSSFRSRVSRKRPE